MERVTTWICDNCLKVDIFKYEAKICTMFNEATDLINNIKSTVLSTVECEIPRIIEKSLPAQINENVVRAFNVNLPSYRDVLTNGTGNTKTPPADEQKQVNQFVTNSRERELS